MGIPLPYCLFIVTKITDMLCHFILSHPTTTTQTGDRTLLESVLSVVARRSG